MADTPNIPEVPLMRIDRSGKNAPRGGPRRKTRLGPWIGLGLVVVALWIGWPKLSLMLADMKAIPVLTGTAIKTRPNASAELTTASGNVVARTRAALSSKVSGRLVDLKVDVGSRVKKGDILAKIEDDLYRAARDQAQAGVDQARNEMTAAEVRVRIAEKSVDKAKRELDELYAAINEAKVEFEEAERVVARERLLNERGAGMPDALAHAVYKRDLIKASLERAAKRVGTQQAAVASSEAEVRGMEARISVAREAVKGAEAQLATTLSNLGDTEIRAPFDGVVLRKEADVGEMVVPALMGGGQTRGSVVTLADFTTLEMEVDVFERDLRLVKEGSPAEIVLDAYPDERLPGVVRQVEPTADRQKATVMVKVTFNALDPRIIPDMGGRVVFLRERTESAPKPEVLVPSDALTTVGGDRGVFLFEGDRARFTRLSVGDARGKNTVVKAGLKGGEIIILTPPAGLADGAAVRKEKTDG